MALWKHNLTTEQCDEFVRKGFIISCIKETKEGDIYEVQKIDDPEAWALDTGIIPAILNSDTEAKELAIKEGFIFADNDNPYMVTGKH